MRNTVFSLYVALIKNFKGPFSQFHKTIKIKTIQLNTHAGRGGTGGKGEERKFRENNFKTPYLDRKFVLTRVF